MLIDTHFNFFIWSNTSDYVAKLLEKDQFLCNNIVNVINQSYHNRNFAYELTNYIYVQEQFWALIIVYAIIFIFYIANQKFLLTSNTASINFLNIFYPNILVFLFAMIYYNISKYQNSRKVMILFDKKIELSTNYFFDKSWFYS